jgi:hydrogenase nickel incorporation protein HypB
MCTTCGCEGPGAVIHEARPPLLGGPHQHGHTHPHPHPEKGEPRYLRAPSRKLIEVQEDLLARNDRLAARLREGHRRRRVLALNLLGGPGAGKTTLLEQTIRALAPTQAVAVLEGDQETSHDAERVRAAGARSAQINTGAGCHLDAAMVEAGLRTLEPAERSLLLIENVGNLVCPALFDLGEQAKVVVLSVAEGEDKPLKYPHVFRAASVLVLNKIDLLPHLSFDVERCLANARQVNPRLRVFRTSARDGHGVAAWCEWIRGELAALQQPAA